MTLIDDAAAAAAATIMQLRYLQFFLYFSMMNGSQIISVS
jgi:hypothetical protein